MYGEDAFAKNIQSYGDVPFLYQNIKIEALQMLYKSHGRNETLSHHVVYVCVCFCVCVCECFVYLFICVRGCFVYVFICVCLCM